MSYTHTFEIDIKGMKKIDGEIDFTSNNNGLKIGALSELEISTTEAKKLLNILRMIIDECKSCSCLNKLEIKIKE